MKRWRGLFVTGTDTGVGKTVVTAAIAAALREDGWIAGVWKPVQSGGLLGGGTTDAECLLRWSGVAERPEAIAPFSYEAPLAPMLAARLAGVKLTLEEVVAAGAPLAERYEVLLIEGAGGVAVPLAEDALVADLIAELRVPALIVARAGLGTINHTLLTAAYLRQRHIPIAGVVLNDGASASADPSAVTNAELIEQYGGLKVLGRFPRLDGAMNRGTLAHAAREAIQLGQIRQALADWPA
ncbi:dethiobiotin synthase [Paenibacillus soyae]|uniref:ATP-dependent dethiobiotin synthetase BioD n=1 Tax=Paenibacillus soyae TaxID=2969249 RepID=A0A9X2S984_9BACL|nr:dethiobiotin synthase [Paenibacillus soyae]MCR2805204.1 dethiobiotin synthase [Paenibacillus soyae]